MNAIRPPYTAAFNDYVRRELGYKSDSEYFIFGGGVTSPWNWNVSNGYADTSMPFKDAMAKNPYMKSSSPQAITTWQRHSTPPNTASRR